MNERLIGAEPYFCEKVNRDIVLALFEEEFITGDIKAPIKMVRVAECMSYGETPDCKTCPKHTK